MELREIPLDDLAALRAAKVDGLRVRAFTARHENAVRAGRCYRLAEGSAEPGYAILHESAPEGGARRLVEFEVEVPWRGRAASYFAETVRELEAVEVEVRSDDAAALEAALAFASQHGWDARPVHALYALETGVLRRPPRPEGAEVRPLSAEEAEPAVAVFAFAVSLPAAERAHDRIEAAARHGRLWGLFREGRLAGAAEVMPEAWHRYADLRAVVHPEFRRSGSATYLIGEVSQALLHANHRLLAEQPVASRAPRRIAENLGLTLAAHRLLLRKL